MEAILNTDAESKVTLLPTTKPHEKLETLLRMDKKLNDLYTGVFPKGERSEAEMMVVCKLKGYGFANDEIRASMEGCTIGKWQEQGAQYQDHTLKNADEYIAQKDTEEQAKKTKGDDEPKTVYVGKPTVVTDEFLAEMVWNRQGLPEYLVYNFQSDSFSRTAQIDLGETDARGRRIIYVPRLTTA